MEGEGYPKCRFFSVKTDLWHYKKAHACLIHVRKEWNLGVAVGMACLIYCAGRGTLVVGAALAAKNAKGAKGLYFFLMGRVFASI
jgi:hypothetical protein